MIILASTVSGVSMSNRNEHLTQLQRDTLAALSTALTEALQELGWCVRERQDDLVAFANGAGLGFVASRYDASYMVQVLCERRRIALCHFKLEQVDDCWAQVTARFIKSNYDEQILAERP
jgi:hypothetical protein